MSRESPGATWQQAELVETFLSERARMMPMLDVQEDLLRRLFTRHTQPVRRFLDLGSGAGAMSELMLSLEPQAEAVLVDFSEPMLERAERSLAGTGARWQTARGDLSEPAWRADLPFGIYDAAISAFAIHHLPSARKRALFREIYELLEPGAMFVNMDYVAIGGPLRGLWDEEMLANVVQAERERGGERSAEEIEGLLPDDGDDDRPDTAEDQVRWLRGAGFQSAEVHFKWAEAAIFGGIKPSYARVGQAASSTQRRVTR